MSRSGYSDSCEGWELIMWRGAVARAIRGKRGQSFLKEVLAALDALPEKKLIESELVHDGQCCTLGAVALKRGIDVSKVDAYDYERVADVFDIARALAQEIEYENDEGTYRAETPEERFVRMRQWVTSHIKEAVTA